MTRDHFKPKLAAIGAAAQAVVERATREQELEVAAKIAAERMPVKDAIAQIAQRLQADLDAALLEAVQRYLCAPLTDPEILRGRLFNYADPPETPAEERGETFVMDETPILWAGPVKLEREEMTMRGSRSMRQLLPEPVAVGEWPP